MLKLGKIVGLGLIIASFGVNSNAQVFGRDEEKYDDIRDFKKWNEVVKKQEMDMIVNGPVTEKWKENIALIEKMNLNREDKIKVVNDFINKSIVYTEDRDNYHMNDYWASPTEALTRGYGDCEDYALAKYFTLKQLGVPEDEMRIVVLNDTRKNILHAILVIENNDGGTNYVLDNQNKAVMMDNQIAYYIPIYSINERNWWKNT